MNNNISDLPKKFKGLKHDFSSDQVTFKGVNWGKAMMWIFLVSDTFIFSCFLIAYMTVRGSTPIPWPNPSEVFALTIFGIHVPLLPVSKSPLQVFLA